MGRGSRRGEGPILSPPPPPPPLPRSALPMQLLPPEVGGGGGTLAADRPETAAQRGGVRGGSACRCGGLRFVAASFDGFSDLSAPSSTREDCCCWHRFVVSSPSTTWWWPSPLRRHVAAAGDSVRHVIGASCSPRSAAMDKRPPSENRANAKGAKPPPSSPTVSQPLPPMVICAGAGAAAEFGEERPFGAAQMLWHALLLLVCLLDSDKSGWG